MYSQVAIDNIFPLPVRVGTYTTYDNGNDCKSAWTGYQSGYLTIKGFDERFRNYLLEFPNDEVRYGFVDFLVPWNRLMKKATWYLIRRMDAKW